MNFLKKGMKVVVALADILFIFPHFFPCVDVPFGGGKVHLGYNSVADP
jgi:hypothetical protein